MDQDFFPTLKIYKNDENSMFLEIGPNFGEVPSGELQSNFSGPAGGSRTTRVHSPHANELHDSESLSALKSNMGEGEIWFFRLTDYL